ncbi:AbrB/MazE/SpoVT family DNA-binding domain-containing protein [Chryseobacterium sp. MP_3.2]|uniref:AbrB/MazE/SpoVT family DNA-binding domain-containing protein n=1 Tax=Chryseobacterium sp. MP_3.2 TaxID=3071712 RepID=UPI002DFAE04A|nr:antitoxin MazE [Chryseobacterium sp. MP_3.2]
MILSKRVLEEVNIEPKDELEIVVKEGKILIQKVTEVTNNWTEQFLKAGSLQDETMEMTFSNKFEEEGWTW